jgi:hypothetical protein
MSDVSITVQPIKQSKKAIRKLIQEKLSISLADYRSIVGEKKFDNRVKKVARLFGTDIIKAAPKKKKKAV